MTYRPLLQIIEYKEHGIEVYAECSDVNTAFSIQRKVSDIYKDRYFDVFMSKDLNTEGTS